MMINCDTDLVMVFSRVGNTHLSQPFEKHTEPIKAFRSFCECIARHPTVARQIGNFLRGAYFKRTSTNSEHCGPSVAIIVHHSLSLSLTIISSVCCASLVIPVVVACFYGDAK